MQQQYEKEDSTGSTEKSGLEVKDSGSTRRRTSKEDKKVNFVEEGTQPTAKELHKRESQKDFSAPRGSLAEDGSPRSQRKFISTWKMACDKTKDRTKELLKRWRTMPDGTGCEIALDRPPLQEVNQNNGDHGWSVHVWGVIEDEEGDGMNKATWVKRYPSGDESAENEKKNKTSILTEVQKEKLTHFFAHVFDMDRDDIISLQDIESFTERLRHFADWSTNCGEYLVLEQVQQGFVDTFILPIRPENESDGENTTPVDIDRLFLSIDDWLVFWNDLLVGLKNVYEMPLWLQYFPKVLFKAINRSGNGVISLNELSAFYTSVMGFPTAKVSELIRPAYKAMTANGEMKLTYNVYRLCFANFLLGRFPNGPGSFLFGFNPKQPTMFPIDYSAMNTLPEDLEPYIHDSKSNRSSIVV